MEASPGREIDEKKEAKNGLNSCLEVVVLLDLDLAHMDAFRSHGELAMLIFGFLHTRDLSMKHGEAQLRGMRSSFEFLITNPLISFPVLFHQAQPLLVIQV